MPLLDAWIQHCQMMILAFLFAQESVIVHLLSLMSSVVLEEEQAVVPLQWDVHQMETQASRQQPWELIQLVLQELVWPIQLLLQWILTPPLQGRVHQTHSSSQQSQAWKVSPRRRLLEPD